MKPVFFILLFAAAAFSQTPPPVTTAPAPPDPSVMKTPPYDHPMFIAERYARHEHINFLTSAMWTVTHDYRDKKQLDKVLEDFGAYMEAFQQVMTGDHGPLEKLGGVKSYKDKVSAWLGSDDQAIRAFAAVLTGLNGDPAKIPELVAIINKKEAEHDEDLSSVYEKGRAAMALGLLKANENKKDILPLLKSRNMHSRSGAITALTLLGAKEHAREVAAILTDKSIGYNSDESPIYFLVETGTARDYKKELTNVMLTSIHSEMAVAAMYALVKIGAKETAPLIARFLNDEYKGGDAAKALALLGARQYAVRIAAMLNGKNRSRQSAAALALGILGAKQYAPKLAAIMDDKTDGNFANSYAAAALIMMDAADHKARASEALRAFKAKRVFLTANSFHGLVLEQIVPFLQKVDAASR